jgi:hypothetical protein
VTSPGGAGSAAPGVVVRVDDAGPEAILLRVVGRLDLGGLSTLRRAVNELPRTRPWLVLDLAGVPECHPDTPVVLAATHRRLCRRGQRLALWRLRTQPRAMLAAQADGRAPEIHIATGDLGQWLHRWR